MVNVLFGTPSGTGEDRALNAVGKQGHSGSVDHDNPLQHERAQQQGEDLAVPSVHGVMAISVRSRFPRLDFCCNYGGGGR
jgi:hypothetical protein